MGTILVLRVTSPAPLLASQLFDDVENKGRFLENGTVFASHEALRMKILIRLNYRPTKLKTMKAFRLKTQGSTHYFGIGAILTWGCVFPFVWL